jgi:rubredoxin
MGPGIDILDTKYQIKKSEIGNVTSEIPPQKCPQCQHNDFVKLMSEKGTGFIVMTIIGFLFDLFTTVHSSGLDTLNQRRPGWMCKNCGWEFRVKNGDAGL